ncbi:MAG: hypothetical protein Q4A88_01405 [Clostridia bacterium]|nr:hypothetical protein [Clostridia bacterium]
MVQQKKRGMRHGGLWVSRGEKDCPVLVAELKNKKYIILYKMYNKSLAGLLQPVLCRKQANSNSFLYRIYVKTSKKGKQKACNYEET